MSSQSLTKSGAEGSGLRSGQIGTLDLVAFVVACAAPLTLMAGVAPIAIAIGGVGAPSAYIFAMVVLAFFAVGYVAMARHIRNAGAFYAFIGAGLGRLLGSAAGVMTLVAYFMFVIGQTIGTAVFGQLAIGYFTGAEVPWPILAIVIAILLGWLGYNRVTLNARVLAIALALEMLVLVVLAVAVFARGGANGITAGSFMPENIFVPGMAVVLIFSFGAFLGVEATAIYSEEARNPGRTVPRATYIAVFLLGIFYAIVCWMIVLAFGEAKVAEEAGADPEGLFFTAMADYVGSFGVGTMFVMLVVSIFASTLAFHNESNRYMYALARDGILPSLFARTRAKTRSPWIAGVFQVAVVVVVIVIFAVLNVDPYLEGFIFLAAAAVVGVLLAQWLSTIAVIAYFGRDRRDATLWQRLIAPLVAFVGLGFALFLMITNFEVLTGASGNINILIFIPITVGFVYGLVRAMFLRKGGGGKRSAEFSIPEPEETAR